MGKYLLRAGLFGELYEEFGDFSLLEDKYFDDGSEFGELLIDELIGDFECYGIIDTDEQYPGRFLFICFFQVPTLLVFIRGVEHTQ